MRCSGLIGGAFAAAALAASVPASGQDRAERQFVAMWMVQASDAPTGTRSVNDGELVFRNRLLPPSLIRLSADATDRESGRVVAAAGTQLFGLLTRGAPIYCVVGRRDPGVAQRLLLGGGNRQICLTDLDKDGSLDAHFSAGNQVQGVPSFTGRRPRDPDGLTGAAYERLSPDEIEIDYYVGVKFEGTAWTNRTPIFSIVYGSDQSEGQLTSNVTPVRDSAPPLVRPLMAEFVVTDVRGDTIDIDVRRNVPAQPFHVVHTVTYSFY